MSAYIYNCIRNFCILFLPFLFYLNYFIFVILQNKIKAPTKNYFKKKFPHNFVTNNLVRHSVLTTIKIIRFKPQIKATSLNKETMLQGRSKHHTACCHTSCGITVLLHKVKLFLKKKLC